MKSTKNLIFTSLTLAIALLTSMQVTAMERTINPNLTPSEVSQLESNIENLKYLLQHPTKKMNKKIVKKAIEQKETMLYGDQPYTMHEAMGVTHIRK